MEAFSQLIREMSVILTLLISINFLFLFNQLQLSDPSVVNSRRKKNIVFLLRKNIPYLQFRSVPLRQMSLFCRRY